jgi:hypothetical protein
VVRRALAPDTTPPPGPGLPDHPRHAAGLAPHPRREEAGLQSATPTLAALQEQLTILDQDHALLVGVQQTLAGATPTPARDTEPAGAPADVPQAAVPRARKPKTAPRTPKPSAGNKSATNTGTGGSSSSGAPTLVELVVADLTGHSEPRSATAITTALTQAHPARTMQTPVVRNTLEALVAKGQSLRSKQGRSVYYSAAHTAPAAGTAGKSAATTA